MATSMSQARPNYWFFFLPFTTCALLGIAGIVAAEMLMPDNAGGMRGRLAIYRHLGTATLVWSSISIWSWHKIRMARLHPPVNVDNGA